LSDSNFTCYSI